MRSSGGWMLLDCPARVGILNAVLKLKYLNHRCLWISPIGNVRHCAADWSAAAHRSVASSSIVHSTSHLDTHSSTQITFAVHSWALSHSVAVSQAVGGRAGERVRPRARR